MDFPRIWASLCFVFLLRFLKYVLILLNNSEQSPTQVTTVQRDAGISTDVSGGFPLRIHLHRCRGFVSTRVCSRTVINNQCLGHRHCTIYWWSLIDVQMEWIEECEWWMTEGPSFWIKERARPNYGVRRGLTAQQLSLATCRHCPNKALATGTDQGAGWCLRVLRPGLVWAISPETPSHMNSWTQPGSVRNPESGRMDPRCWLQSQRHPLKALCYICRIWCF